MAFTDSKPHYALLDGLRGVAALLVVWYHVFEGYQFAGNKPVIDFINHGYLAVDFFFMLSGFVIGYAYDDRWGKSLTTSKFFRRRLIRLHPMVMMGALIGAISFLLTGMERWDSSHSLHAAPHPHSPHLFMAHDSRTTRNAPRSTRQRRDVSPQRSLLVPLL